MFPTVRQTRRQVHPIDGRRRTAKVQRGGAPFYTIPKTRINDWIPHFTRLGFTNRAKPATQLSQRNLPEYFMSIEKQDELFDAALKIIANKVGLPEPYNSLDVTRNTSEINSRKQELFEYISDVEQMVNFSKIKHESGKQKLNYTKLEDIEYLPSETLSSLLIFPKRLSNIWIETIARMLIILKKDDTILKQVLDSDGKIVEETRVLVDEQYDSNIRGNARIQTARPLRDGFYISQTKQEIENELNSSNQTKRFFYKLIEVLLYIKDQKEDYIFKEIDGSGHVINLKNYPYNLEDGSLDSKWDLITAHVFLAYKFNKHDNILQFFKTLYTTIPPTSTDPHDHPYLPDPENDEIVIRGTTMTKINSWMYDIQLHYILHLCYKITVLEKEVLAELESSNDEEQELNSNTQFIPGSGTP